MKFYKRFLLIFLSVSLFFCPVAKAVDYDQEWLNSSAVLDLINAAVAYENGITGLDIVVGVIDEMINVSHVELLGKATSNIAIFDDGTIFDPDWALNTHATHVAGIIAAARDGEGMFGVAYDSSVAGLVFLAEVEVDGEETTLEPSVDIEQFFQDNPDMRIVNNSWGSTFYPFGVLSDGTIDNDITIAELTTLLVEESDSISTLTDLVEYAINNPEILLVFAAGNDGQISASFEGLSPRYYGSELNNFISVGSLDSNYITMADDGSITVDSSGISSFSNLAVGAERWTVFAPGSSIYSLDASTGGYTYMSGTSMASPVVSGSAALVQQVFPWMTGTQLASTILSTANDSFTAPEYIVSYSDLEGYYYFYIRYIDAESSVTPTTDEVKAMISYLIDTSFSHWNFTEEEKTKFIDNVISNNYYEVQYLTKEQVFGQGILDVAKAIGGIAELDANRMTEENVVYVSELGTNYAVDNFNTAGYNAVFSNDISQFQWDDYYHHEEYQTTATTGYNDAALALSGLDIGIMKSGEGTLVLTGTSSYSGATLVEGGTLALMTTSDGTGGTLENSSVVVRSEGTFAGDGVVSNSLINSGTVSPGSYSLLWYEESTTSNSTLTVGDYTQTSDGLLSISFDVDGNYGKLNVNNNADLAGSLYFTPEVGFYQDNSTYSLEGFFTASTVSGYFENIAINPISPTLSFVLSEQGTYDYNILMARASDAYTQYAIGAGASSVGSSLYSISSLAQGDMQTLLTTLDFSSLDGSVVTTALTQLGAETYDQLINNSFLQQRSYNSSVLGNMLRTKDDISAVESDTWQAWGSIIGSFTHQSKDNSSTSWDSSTAGIITGFDRAYANGLTLGTHVILAAQSLTADSGHDAQTDTTSLHIGVHGLYNPYEWDGIYLTGMARIGIENNDMERNISFDDYVRTNKSDWTDFTGSTLLGIGKDWNKNNIFFGPIAWLEYSFISRPNIKESNGLASRLNIEGDIYSSLPLSLGGHIGTAWQGEKSSLALDFLAAWQYETLDPTIQTTASFIDYTQGFTSATARTARNSLLLQSSIRYEVDSNFSIQGDISANISKATNLNLGLTFGYSF